MILTLTSSSPGREHPAQTKGTAERLLRLVHITDTHCVTTTKEMSGKPSGYAVWYLLGLKAVHWKDLVHSFEILESTVEMVNKKLKPDLVIITGDLTNGGASLEDMKKVKDVFDKLDCKYHALIGDHDSKRNYESVFGKTNATLAFRGWFFVFLTIHPSEEDIQWLQSVLERHSEDPIVLCTHRLIYCPRYVLLSARFFKGVELRLQNHERILRLLEERDNLALVLSGHCHQSLFFKRGKKGPGYFTTDSLCEPPHQLRVIDFYRDRIESFLIEGGSLWNIRKKLWKTSPIRACLRERLELIGARADPPR